MIKLAFTGDIMLSREVGQLLDSKNEDYNLLSIEVREKLKSCDFVIGNLESPIAVNADLESISGFKANPLALSQIKEFDLLTLANNHIFDCGKNGANETLEHLSRSNFHTCGLKRNSEDDSLFIYEGKSKKIGFLAAAVGDCIKNENSLFPQIVSAEAEGFLMEVNNASRKVDYLFTIIHGGNEMISYPEPSFRELCVKLIEAGATSVITHHPHVLGGMEYVNGNPIFYSLGDFIFDGKSYKRRRGAILEIKILEDTIDYKLLPTKINDDLSIDLAGTKTSKFILNRWNMISKRIATSSSDKEFKSLYMRELASFQLDRLKFILNQEGLGATLKFVFQKVNLLGFYTLRILKGKIK